MRMIDNDEGPLFLADGTRVEVLQTESSGLPVKFVLHGDLTDLTFQRGMGIIEARMQVGKDVRIAKLTSVHIGDRKAAEAAQQGAPSLPQPPQQPKTPEEKGKLLANNVAKASDETVALDVQVSAAQGGTKFVLTIINTTEKLVPFSFKSSQSYDFAVVDESTGQEIWRWSRRMLFSQVLRQEALRATKNWTFEVVWNHRDNDLNVVSPGKYKVIGSLTSQPPMESESVAFEIK